MKILYITDIVPKFTGGPANAVPPRILAQSKVDDVFWLNINDYFEWQNDSFKFDFGSEWQNKSLDDIPFEPDIIVFQGVLSWVRSSKYPKDARKKSIPYVVLPHSQLNFKARDMNNLFKFIGTPKQFEVFVYHAKAVQFFTEEQKAESVYFGAPTIIIPNGVQEQKFIRRTLKDKISAMFIGRVVPQKGLDIFINACTPIKDFLREKNFFLDIYGSNSSSLKEQIDSAELQDIIHLHNPIFGVEKDTAFKNANLFILPSRYEGQPVALLEALSYSLPVLTTTAANMTEVISSAKVGLVASPSVESIRQNLIDLLNDIAFAYPNMANSAYQLSKKYFWSKIALDTHNIYKKLI